MDEQKVPETMQQSIEEARQGKLRRADHLWRGGSAARKQKRAWKLYAKALRAGGDDFRHLITALELALKELQLTNEGLVYIKPLDLFVNRDGDIYVVKKGKRAEKLTIIRQKSKTIEQQHNSLWPSSLISRKI